MIDFFYILIFNIFGQLIVNYIKKIKSLGFKKIPTVVVCEYPYDSNLQGYYIETLSQARLLPKKDTFVSSSGNGTSGKGLPNFKFPIVTSIYYNKISSYIYKVSENVELYLILFGSEYTLVVKDNTRKDFKSYGEKMIKNNITVPIQSKTLVDGFWKEILKVIGKDIQRDILIKQICKFK